MSAKTILVALFLISLGVVVLLGLRALPERSSTDVTADEVLVAAVALPQGTLLRAKDVIWRQVLSAAKSDHIVHSATEAGNLNTERGQQMRAEVYGAALRNGVEAGEPVAARHRRAVLGPGSSAGS